LAQFPLEYRLLFHQARHQPTFLSAFYHLSYPACHRLVPSVARLREARLLETLILVPRVLLAPSLLRHPLPLQRDRQILQASPPRYQAQSQAHPLLAIQSVYRTTARLTATIGTGSPSFSWGGRSAFVYRRSVTRITTTTRSVSFLVAVAGGWVFPLDLDVLASSSRFLRLVESLAVIHAYSLDAPERADQVSSATMATAPKEDVSLVLPSCAIVRDARFLVVAVRSQAQCRHAPQINRKNATIHKRR
jgi:hypothetical protein